MARTASHSTPVRGRKSGSRRAARSVSSRAKTSRTSANLDPTPVVVWQPAPKFQDRVWLHVLLFALTIASTMVAGAQQYLGFLDDFRGSATLPMSLGALFIRGFWYAGTILAILGCHELGHYFACRYYDVDASLPFFIPVPVLLTGTMGAFIRIREPIRTKPMLFDIGIAGPITGFAAAVPALFIGMAMSKVDPAPSQMPPCS